MLCALPKGSMASQSGCIRARELSLAKLSTRARARNAFYSTVQYRTVVRPITTARMPVKELGLTICRFAKRLRHNCASEIAADPWGFKRKAKRLLGLYLPPGPGRPRKETITRAHELNRQGTPWPEIYSQCIPQYASLRWRERRLEIGRLRNGVRARQRLEGKAVLRRPQLTGRKSG